MAITVSHQPDFSLLARAGYQAGFGEFLSQERARQQQERMQMRGIAANEHSQQMAQQAAMQRQVTGDQMTFQRQAAMERMNQDFRRELENNHARNRFEELRFEMENKRQMQQMGEEMGAQADVSKFLIGQAEEAMSGIREALSEGYEFEGNGAQRWEAIQREIGILQQDPTISPMARAQAIYRKIFEEAPLPAFKRPEFSEEVEGNTHWVKDPVTGENVLIGRAREFSSLHSSKIEKEEAQPKRITEDDVFGDPKEYRDWLKLADEMLTEETYDDAGKVVKKRPDLKAKMKWIRENIRGINQQGEPEEEKKEESVTRVRWTPNGVQPVK